jgi:hypothetical protein
VKCITPYYLHVDLYEGKSDIYSMLYLIQILLKLFYNHSQQVKYLTNGEIVSLNCSA